MTIHQLSEKLNEKAILEGFAIAELPELRKKYLHKKLLPAHIFTAKTIFDGDDKYAFHHGGRDEIQFNVGEEYIDNVAVTRFGLCFSLETSPSLHHPVEDLEPFRIRFNDCFETNSDLFKGFKMWYFQNGKRHGNFEPQKITNKWFQHKTFICLGKIIEKPLSSLNDDDLKKILSGFDKLLPIYQFCVLQKSTAISKTKIFTRLTSNDNNWELPSPHRWSKENQGKKNLAFENQYGFGHEEWLFNPRYNFDGYQYGYIRGIENANDGVRKYEEVHLYTFKAAKTQKLVFYLGFIKNVIVIKNEVKEQNKISKVIERYKSDTISEVENIHGDTKGIIKWPYKPDVKFKMHDVVFWDEPIYQPLFNLGKYKRFQPYQFTGSIDEIFAGPMPDNNTTFASGKASQTSVYNRKNRETSLVIEKLHSEMVEALEGFLSPEYSLKNKRISIETMRFQGNIADVVTKEKDTSITIYEVKTSASGRRNIRDAIGQLLDYALHAGNLKVERLVIVSPVELVGKDMSFLNNIRRKIGFAVGYYYYSKGSKVKFIEQ